MQPNREHATDAQRFGRVERALGKPRLFARSADGLIYEITAVNAPYLELRRPGVIIQDRYERYRIGDEGSWLNNRRDEWIRGEGPQLVASGVSP